MKPSQVGFPPTPQNSQSQAQSRQHRLGVRSNSPKSGSSTHKTTTPTNVSHLDNGGKKKSNNTSPSPSSRSQHISSNSNSNSTISPTLSSATIGLQQLTIQNVIKLSPNEVRNHLSQRERNSSGSAQEITKRLMVTIILEAEQPFDQYSAFDASLEVLVKTSVKPSDLLLSPRKELRARLDSQNISEELKDAVLVVNRIYELLRDNKLLRQCTHQSTQQEIKKIVETMKEMIFDLIPPEKQRKTGSNDVEDAVCSLLGYHKQDVDSMETEKLKMIMKDDSGAFKKFTCRLWKQAYEEDESYLRFSMKNLWDSVLRAEMDQRHKRTTTRLPQVLQNKLKVSEISCDEIFKELENLSFSETRELATELKLKVELSDIDFLNTLDDTLASVQHALLTLVTRRSARYNIEMIHNALPPPMYNTFQKTELTTALISSDCILFKKTIVGNNLAEIREIGIQANGYLVESTLSETEAQSVPWKISMKFDFKNKLDESASRSKSEPKSIDTKRLFNQAKTLQTVFFKLKSDESEDSIGPEYYQLHIANETTSKLINENQFEAFEILTIPSRHIHLANQSVPFQRLIMQIKLHSQQHKGVFMKMIQNMINAMKQTPENRGYSETGETIASVLAFTHWMTEHEDVSFAEKLKEINNYPNLLYNLSDFLRVKVCTTINALIKKKWEQTLQINNRFDSQFLSEAKKSVLFALLTGGPEDKHIAVVTQDHFNYIQKAVEEFSKHLLYTISIEKSNFQAVLRNLDKMNQQSGIVLCAIQVTGNLSPLDLAHLVDRYAHGSLRLIILFYPQLLYSLQLTGKLGALIMPESLNHLNRIKVINYDTQTVIGALIEKSTMYFHNHLKDLRLVNELEDMLCDLRSRMSWEQEEQQWRNSRVDPQDKYSEKMFRLAVCDDTSYIQMYYTQQQNKLLKLIDCKKDGLDPNSLEEGINSMSDGEPFCVVLLNAHLTSFGQRCFFMTRALSSGIKVIMVTPQFNPEELEIRVLNPTTQTKVVIHGIVWICRYSKASMEQLRRTNKNSFQMFRVLRLILGPIMKMEFLLVPSNNLLQQLRLEGSQHHNITLPEEILKEILDQVISAFTPQTDFYPEDVNDSFIAPVVKTSSSTLQSYITDLCVGHVKDNQDIATDISFHEFVSLSQLCQFLPQHLRVEAWIRTVLETQREPQTMLVSMYASRNQGVNTHSLHLLHCLEDRRESKSTLEQEPATYTYLELDYSINYHDLVLQQCIQKNELNWSDLTTRWKSFPFSLDFLMTLIRIYHQPLKLLVLISTTHLFRLLESAKRDKFPDAIAKLERYFLKEPDNITLKIMKRVPQVALQLSALKWVLLGNGNIQAQTLLVSNEDVDNLIASHIPIKIKNAESADSALPIILQLERPIDIINRQLSLRSFLWELYNPTLPKDLQYGSSFIDFLLNDATRERLSKQPQDNKLFLRQEPFQSIMNWADINPNSFVDPRLCTQLLQLAEVFSADAIGYLLSRSTSLTQIKSLVPLLKKIQRANASVVSKIMTIVIEKQLQHESIVYLLSELTAVKTQNELYDTISEVFQTGDFVQLEKLYLDKKFNAHLPLESCDKLTQLFTQFYDDKRFLAADISSICGLFAGWLTEVGCESVLTRIMETSADNNNTRRQLVFIVWMLNPVLNIPFLPTEAEMPTFKNFLDDRNVAFCDRVSRNIETVSNFALYLCAPHYLDFEVLNFYRKEMSEEPISSGMYLICQASLDQIYCIIPQRPLPDVVLQYFDRIIPEKLKEESPSFPQVYEDSMSYLQTFRVVSGVDESTLVANLKLLRDILYYCENHKQFAKDTAPVVACVANLLSGWFWACGINSNWLENWLEQPIKNILQDFESEHPQHTWYTEQLVDFTFPCFLDTKLARSTINLKMFGLLPEEAQNTYNYFSAFMMNVKPTSLPAPNKLLQLKQGNLDATAEYLSMHQQCAASFGAYIAPKISRVAKSSKTEKDAVYCSQVEPLEEICRPFSRCLVAISQSEELKTRLNEMLDAFLEACNAVFDPNGKTQSISQALTTRVLMRTVSISAVTENLIKDITDAIIRNNFSACRTTLNEIETYFTHARKEGLINTASKRQYFYPTEGVKLIKFCVDKPNLPQLHFTILDHSPADNMTFRLNLESIKVSSQNVEFDSQLMASVEQLDGESATSSVFHLGERNRNSESQEAAGFSSTQLKVSLTHSTDPWIIFAGNLLAINPDGPIATLSVKPGSEGFLIRQSQDHNIFSFIQGSPETLSRNGKQWTDILSKHATIEATWAHNGIAWEAINKQAPPLSLIVLDGMLLKKANAGDNWLPMVLSAGQDTERRLYFYDIIKVHNIFCWNLPVSVQRLLFFLARWLYRCFQHTQTQKESQEVVLEWLHNIENLPKSELKDVQIVAEAVCKVVEGTLSRCKEKKRIADIFVEEAQIKEKAVLLNCWKQIELRIEPFILQSAAYHEDIKKILRCEVPAELASFFTEAFKNACKDFMHKIIPFQPTTLPSEIRFAPIPTLPISPEKVSPRQQKHNGNFSDAESDDEGYMESEQNATQTENTKPFEGKHGFGSFANWKLNQVIAIQGPHPRLFAYFVQPGLASYHPSDGLPLAFILHENLHSQLGLSKENEAQKKQQKTDPREFSNWLIAVLLSPLPEKDKKWFLKQCQAPLIEAMPSVQAKNVQAIVVGHCLACSCPDSSLCEYLKASCKLPEEVEPFCRRRDDKYGVYICNPEVLRDMRKAGLYVEEHDLSSVASSGTTMVEEMYLRIISNFSSNISFVFVHGLETIEDLFLKWCCENTDTSYNFSENRDRCDFRFADTVNYGQPSSSTEIQQIRFEKQPLGVKPLSEIVETIFQNHPEARKQKSKLKSHWEAKFTDEYLKSSQCVILLISPPGAGKSHHLRHYLCPKERKNGRICEWVDCSNDELVDRALASILSEKFPQEGINSLLVADEYHMLSPEHKHELFTWISTRLHWLKVVLIGNRSDAFDSELLLQLTKEMGSSVNILLLASKLSRQKIFDVNRPKQAEFEKFLRYWIQASRALFSNESISLRIIGPILEAFERTSDKAQRLTDILAAKMPTLGTYCCQKFVQYLLELFQWNTDKGLAVYRSPPKEFMPPLKLLIWAGLGTFQTTCSYSEFTSTWNSHEYHPIFRLSAWIQHIYGDQKISDSILESLESLTVIDQMGFPCIVNECSTDKTHLQVSAFARQGVHTDINWITETLKHGFAVNWEKVKALWKEQYITNAKRLAELLSVCQNPGICLSCVDSRNLCILIENQDDTTLPRKCLEYYNVSESELDNVDSVYYTSAWFLFRNSTNPVVDLAGVNIRNLLLWASENAFDRLAVTVDQTKRSKLLKDALIEETKKMLAERKQKPDLEMQIVKLWKSIFAGLLSFGQGGVPYEAAFILAQFDVSPQWPRIVHILHSVFNHSASHTVVQKLYHHPIFQPNDNNNYFEFPKDAQGKILTRFISGLLSLPPGSLSTDWQKRILTTPGIEIPDKLPHKFIAGNLTAGLLQLDSFDKVKIANGNCRQTLGQIWRTKKTSSALDSAPRLESIPMEIESVS